MKPKECSAMVNDFTGFHKFPCSRKPTVQRDGKWYCPSHDPVKVKERQEKAHAKYEATACKNCGVHVFQGALERNYKYCPYCGTKRE
jgi:uncharacterized Zn finger protein (UPF0148 family)